MALLAAAVIGRSDYFGICITLVFVLPHSIENRSTGKAEGEASRYVCNTGDNGVIHRKSTSVTVFLSYQ